MNNLKNLLIAVLTGLLALSLFSQPAQSAANTSAKAIQYDHCLSLQLSNGINLEYAINGCAKYRP